MPLPDNYHQIEPPPEPKPNFQRINVIAHLVGKTVAGVNRFNGEQRLILRFTDDTYVVINLKEGDHEYTASCFSVLTTETTTYDRLTRIPTDIYQDCGRDGIEAGLYTAKEYLEFTTTEGEKQRQREQADRRKIFEKLKQEFGNA